MTKHLVNPWQSPIAAGLFDRMHTESADVERFLELAARAGGPLLEVGCGTGRCLIPLIRAGFDTVGIDSSKAMLDVLKRKLTLEQDEVMHRATAIYDDCRGFSVPLRFGMVFAGANSFSHFLERTEQESFLASAFVHLRPGGLLVIDIFNPDPKQIVTPTPKIRECGSATMNQEVRSIDLASQIISLETILSLDGLEQERISWRLRFSYRFELELLVEKAGFEIVTLWGDYLCTPFGDATDRLFVVARKPKDTEMTVVQFMHAEVPQPV